MQADVAVAHLALDFGFRHERCDGVDDDEVDGTAADERLDDVERLLAAVRLRNQQVVDVDAEVLRIDRVERMLGIDECRDAAVLLRLGNHMQRDRRLARRLRAVDFNDASARDAADAERDVERQDARRDDLDVHVRLCIAEAHDGTLAEIFLNALERFVKGFFSFILIHEGSFLAY